MNMTGEKPRVHKNGCSPFQRREESHSLSSRVERRFMEIEERLRRRGNGDGAPHQDKLIPTTVNYIDEKIEKYKYALELAMRNAPCAGCRRLVLGALTGLAIFEAMEHSDRKRVDISDAEIEKIKKEVEHKYANY